jgi:hypothetical protein
MQKLSNLFNQKDQDIADNLVQLLDDFDDYSSCNIEQSIHYFAQSLQRIESRIPNCVLHRDELASPTVSNIHSQA